MGTTLNSFFRIQLNSTQESNTVSYSDFLGLLNARAQGQFTGEPGWYQSDIPAEVILMYKKAVPADSNSYYLMYSASEPASEEGRYLKTEFKTSEIHDSLLFNQSFTVDLAAIVMALQEAFPETEEFFYSIKHHHWASFLGLDLYFPLEVIDIYCNGVLFSLVFRPEQGTVHLDAEKWPDQPFEWSGDSRAAANTILNTVLVNLQLNEDIISE